MWMRLVYPTADAAPLVLAGLLLCSSVIDRHFRFFRCVLLLISMSFRFFTLARANHPAIVMITMVRHWNQLISNRDPNRNSFCRSLFDRWMHQQHLCLSRLVWWNFIFFKKKTIIPVLLFLFDKTAGAAGSVCREAVSVRCFFKKKL